MNSKFIYNNEGLCILGIMSVLEIVKEITYTKAMLITPIILNKKSLNFLSSKSIIRSLEEFEIKQNIIVSRFNSLYYNYMPITINSLIILNDMGFIELKENTIEIKKFLVKNVDQKRIGERGKKIIKVAQKVVNILNENEEKLYVQLGVEL